MNKLGQLIREARKRTGLSQEKLAILVDYDRSNILNIEAGKKTASDDLLKRISEQIGEPYARLKALKTLDRSDPDVKEWLFAELQMELHQNTISPE